MAGEVCYSIKQERDLYHFKDVNKICSLSVITNSSIVWLQFLNQTTVELLIKHMRIQKLISKNLRDLYTILKNLFIRGL